MDMTAMVDFMSNLIYPLQGIAAIYGLFLTILIFRRIGQKRFRSQAVADDFVNQVRERLQARDFDSLTAVLVEGGPSVVSDRDFQSRSADWKIAAVAGRDI